MIAQNEASVKPISGIFPTPADGPWTIAEAAKRWRCSADTIRKMIRSGVLRAWRFPGGKRTTLYLSRADLEAAMVPTTQPKLPAGQVVAVSAAEYERARQ